jgi:surface polysaccharide O-acyltransferase-like enzyme
MVVAWHARGYCPELSATQGRFVFFLASVCVPIFFLADGYLFAESVVTGRPYTYRSYVHKSAVKLLVPWLFFTVLYALARYPLEQAGFLSDRLIVGRSPATMLLFGWGSVYAGQLYFLMSLFLIRLATPAVRRLCAMKRLKAVFLCAAFYLAYRLVIGPLDHVIRIPGGQEPLLHALWGCQFYLFGVLLRLFNGAVARASSGIAAATLGVLIVLELASPGALVPGRPVTQYLYSLGVFTLFLRACRNKNGTSRIGRSTMGIYLFHAPLLLKAASIAGAKLPAPPLVVYFALTITVFLAAYCLGELVARLPYGSLLLGASGRRQDAEAGNPRLLAAT